MNFRNIQKNLIRRYLIWSYKSARESFERIERKTTQLIVDQHILNTLQRMQKKSDVRYQKHIDSFSEYIDKKKQDELVQKFDKSDKSRMNPEYLYLKNRLEAIEIAIIELFSKSELKKIESLYEYEFTQRILQAKDH